jgi:uncharacterized membrane protein
MVDIKTWLLVLICFLVLDGIWLGIIQKPYLNMVIDRINPTQSLRNSLKHPIWSFILIYLLMSLSLTYFVLDDKRGEKTGDKTKSKKQMYLEAFLLGMTIYATFDFTALNLTGGWTVYDAFKDVAWGIFVFTMTTIIVLEVR